MTSFVRRSRMRWCFKRLFTELKELLEEDEYNDIIELARQPKSMSSVSVEVLHVIIVKQAALSQFAHELARGHVFPSEYVNEPTYRKAETMWWRLDRFKTNWEKSIARFGGSTRAGRALFAEGILHEVA